MKKIILIILILSSRVFAEPFYGFEVGSYVFPDTRVGVVDMQMGYRINFWIFKNEIYGGTRNYLTWGEFNRESLFQAYPFRTTYTIGNRFFLGDRWSIQVEHFCSHKVYSANNERTESIQASSWYRRIGARQTTTYISLKYISD